MDMLNQLADSLLTRLLWTSIQASVLIAVVYLLCRLLPRLSAATRCTLWWLVGLQLLFGLLWQAPLELPLLSPAPLELSASAAPPVTSIATAIGGDGALSTVTPLTAQTPPWRLGIALLWLAAVLLQSLWAWHQWQQTRRLLRESRPLHDAPLQALRSRQARQLGLRRCPPLRTSDTIISPQVTGLWRPTILLPAGRALRADEAAMAIAHELAHLRRGDLWLAWVPAIAQCLFCFHPLVRWAMREYALNRESACDALVLQHDHAAAQDYGRLLLRLGATTPMHSGLASASPTIHNLRRRLIMLRQTADQPASRVRGLMLAAAIGIIGVLPYRVTAAHTDRPPAGAAAARATLPSLPPAPPVPPAPPLPNLPVLPASPPAPPTPPPPAPPKAPALHQDTDIDIRPAASRSAYALFDRTHDNKTVAIRGDFADQAAAERLHTGDAPMFWFRRGDKAYLIRDPALVARARSIYAPVTNYWRDAGKLEGQRWSFKGPLEGLSYRQRSVEEQRSELLADRHAPAVEQRLTELDARQREITARTAMLQKQLAALQPQLDAMAKRQQAVVAAADRNASKLVDEALTKGLAQDVSHR